MERLCKMKKLLLILLSGVLLCSLSGCRQNQKEMTQVETNITERATEVSEVKTNETSAVQKNLTEENNPESTEDTNMKLYFDETEIPVAWENNNSVAEILEEATNGDIVISMSMYGGNEQVGSLGKRYSSNDKQTTTHNGDIVLYNSSNLVVFYGSNSWAYTRLGKMNLSETTVTELLSNGNVSVRITSAQN